MKREEDGGREPSLPGRCTLLPFSPFYGFYMHTPTFTGTVIIISSPIYSIFYNGS